MIEKNIPDHCAECPVARTLSGNALEFLVKDCAGLKVISMGCEDIAVCNSPAKRKDVISTTD